MIQRDRSETPHAFVVTCDNCTNGHLRLAGDDWREFVRVIQTPDHGWRVRGYDRGIGKDGKKKTDFLHFCPRCEPAGDAADRASQDTQRLL